MDKSAKEFISEKYRQLQSQLADKQVQVHSEEDHLKNLYKVGKRIDSDGKRSLYAQVRLCRHRQMGFSRAIKSYMLTSPLLDATAEIVTFRDHNGLTLDAILNEVIVMSELRHPNIVTLHEVFYEQDHIHLIMDLCKGGELYDMISTQRHLTEYKALQLFGQLLQALKYMHGLGIAHRALCIENIMLYDREQTRLKVISFSNAGRVASHHFTNKHGSPLYMAPEVFAGSYTHKCDIWSAGVILFTMLCGYQPFSANTVEELQKILSARTIPKTMEWNSLAPPLKEIIEQMLTREHNRLPASELLRHNTLAKVMDQSQDISDDLEDQSEHVDYYEKLLLGNKLKHAVYSYVACLSALSSDAMEEIRNKLGIEDREHSGYLSEQAVVSIVKSTELVKDSYLDTKLQATIAATPRENGQLQYATFLTLLLQEVQSRALLEKCFYSFDKDNRGVLQLNEITNFFAIGSDDASLWEELRRDCTERGVSSVSFPEFCELIMKYSA